MGKPMIFPWHPQLGPGSGAFGASKSMQDDENDEDDEPSALGFGLGMSGEGQDAQLKNSIDANLSLDDIHVPFKFQKSKD